VAALDAERASGDRCAPAAEEIAVQIRRTENAIAAVAEAALDGLEREAATLALHVHRSESLHDAHAAS
jgi:hypothetical protein